MEADYGSWTSPITGATVAESGIGLIELRLDPSERGKDVVYWNELRYAERGRCVICSRFTGGKILEWTSAEYSARTTVHEYGGGSFFVFNGVVYFSNFKDQRLYKQDAYNQPPIPITQGDRGWRYADGSVFGENVYCVKEDHSVINAEEEACKEPKNTLVRINSVTQEEFVVAEGADFYASPRISLNGQTLVWMQWNHPNMPWDDTEIWAVNIMANGDLQAGSERKLVGSAGVNVMQPQFSPDGGIFFISDQTNWWNLYRHSDVGSHHNVQNLEKEVGGPQWGFGDYAYAFDPNNTSDVAAAFDGELAIINLKSELYYKQETGFTNHDFISFGRDQCVYCIASGPTRCASVIRWNVASGQTEVIKSSQEKDTLDEQYISVPQHIAFPTGDNEKAYGYYYAPKNPQYKGKPNTLPPLLVLAHGGPTGQATTRLDLKKQYYTTRGFAVLDVNYRGSTGYGKAFRRRLQMQWGNYDVEDVCSGALFLSKERRVDRRKLCISGRSAGGYCVLAALTFKDTFCAGGSHFGVGDLEALAKETHKFEARYMDRLIGAYPEAAEEYRKRSPLFSIDKLQCPVIFFQGIDDMVVPKEQAESMYNALKAKDIPTGLALFPGEGHGFKASENIQLAIEGECYFFCRVLGIPCSEVKNVDKLNIANLQGCTPLSKA